MKITSLLTALLLIGLLVVNCKPVQQDQSMTENVIQQNFANIDHPTEIIAVRAEEGKEVELASGSRLSIQPNTFLDANGEVIKGEVQIEFKEFHSVQDLVIAGIPMYHEENGEEGYLATAGMCEIRGTYEGGEVFIDPNKAINVELSTQYSGTEEVGFYVLNESTGEWTLTGAPTPIPDPESIRVQNELDSLAAIAPPTEPREMNPDEPVINFEIYSPTGTAVDHAMWRYAKDDLENNPLQRPEFEDGLYKLVKTQFIDQGNFEIKTTFQLYEEIKRDSLKPTEKVSVNLMPVIFGSELKRARDLYNLRYKMAEERKQRMDELRALNSNFNNVRNAFAVSNWGFFNCDVFSRNPYEQFVLNVKQQSVPLEDAAKLVLIKENGQEPGVLSMEYLPSGIEFRLFKEGECHLLVINGKNEVGVIKNIRTNKNVAFDSGNMLVNIPSVQAITGEGDISEILASL